MNFDTLQIRFKQSPVAHDQNVLQSVAEDVFGQYGVESVSWAAVSGHHVVHSNGRLDLVCACGEHFRAETFAGEIHPKRDAIQQWVAHYKENTPG